MEHYVLAPHHGAGRGRLCRHGRAAVFFVADPAAAASLVGWCRLVGERPADAALGELQRLAGSPGVTAVAAFVLDEGGVTALVYGGVPLFVQRGEGRSPVPNPVGQAPSVVSLGAVDALDVEVAMSPNDPLIELENGVVAADGFSLRHVVIAPPPWAATPATPAAAAADVGAEAAGGTGGAPVVAPAEAEPPPPPVEPQPAPAEPAPAMAASAPAATPPAAAANNMLMSLHGPDDDLPRTEPLPIAGGQGHSHDHGHNNAAAAPANPHEVRVQGLRCSRNHFNDPRARFCAVCGIAMHQASFVLSEDVRPPLGVLVFSDGSFHNLVHSLVFGRDPDDDPRVRSGEAIGVTLVDPGNTISRVHAEVRAVEWDVQLVDRGSTNGTFVWVPTHQQWDRLAPNQPRTLEPGAQVAFGRLTATFESSLRPA